MRFNMYLREICDISKAEYKALPLPEQYSIYNDFLLYNKREQARKNFLASGGIIRQITPEELEEHAYKSAKEKAHRESSMKCGGIVDCAYVALHHR